MNDLLFKSIPRILTNRLTLRPLEMSDVNELLELYNSPYTQEYQSKKEYTLSYLTQKIFSQERKIDEKSEIFWVMERTKDKAFIGIRILYNDSGNDIVEIQGDTKKKYWRKGYTKEAYKGILLYLESRNVKGVNCFINSQNYKSLGLVTGLGFKEISSSRRGLKQYILLIEPSNYIQLDFGLGCRKCSSYIADFIAFFDYSSDFEASRNNAFELSEKLQSHTMLDKFYCHCGSKNIGISDLKYDNVKILDVNKLNREFTSNNLRNGHDFQTLNQIVLSKNDGIISFQVNSNSRNLRVIMLPLLRELISVIDRIPKSNFHALENGSVKVEIIGETNIKVLRDFYTTVSLFYLGLSYKETISQILKIGERYGIANNMLVTPKVEEKSIWSIFKRK